MEKRAVELNVRLPREVAVEAEEVQARDPEMLSRILTYGLTRRAIFEHLSEQSNEGLTAPGRVPFRQAGD